MTVSFYALLPDSAEKRIAVIPKGESVSLPMFQSSDDVRFNTVAGINSAVKANWNMFVTVFRCLAADENGHPAVFALHNHEQDFKLPAEAKWVDVSQLREQNFATKEQRLSVLDWLASKEDNSWRSVPWSSLSWTEKAAKWFTESLYKATGAAVIGVVQVRVWAISCVFRVATCCGDYYFKASPDFWGHEPILARYLSDHFPQYMVDVVDIEPQEHWMLTKEWAGSPPESKEDWCKILQVLIEIQDHCNEKLQDFISLGCEDRRLERLPKLLAPVLDELKQSEMRALYGVNETEANQLAVCIRSLPKLCDKLAEFGIPQTLVHGDLWSSNVIVRDTISGRTPVIFDWTDAAISHPFFDIYCATTSEKDESKRRAAREAHIEIWSKVLPLKVVMDALALSERVAPYYYLHAYRNVELNTPVQARWELLYLLQRFVRKILDSAN